ncbi:hypothetical protein CPB83DRAFT_907458 [Crepidotus variabilis]|uniref:F-box domain-containing protein n=1 Tax=Crepidotus variabilis TaxID=179855 RepID=A0A9P6EEN3_9AGAR|nr:hypothetical protein CPB83DRAFT_907458 [Crepidotus variabilis]
MNSDCDLESLESLEPLDDWDTSSDNYDGLSSSDEFIARLKWTISRKTMKTVAFLQLNEGMEVSLIQACLRRAYVINCSASVSSLPHEILSLIFQGLYYHFLNEEYDEDYNTRPRPEVVVSHVCRFWRDVSLSVPSLWAMIELHSTSRHLEARKAVQPERVREYLARSRNHLLDISVELHGSAAQQANALNLVIPHVDRWETLHVGLGEIFAMGTIASLLSSLSAPRLTNLTIIPQLDRTEERGFEYLPSPQIFTEGAPELSVVRLFSLAMMGLQPPLSNVTTLVLCKLPQYRWPPSIEVGWHMVKPVLSSPNLENLALSGYWFDPPHNAEPAQLLMPKLCHLHFDEFQETDLFWLLWNFNAPKLESLTFKHIAFEITDDDDDDLIPEVNVFASLRTLIFNECKPRPSLVPYISQLCPSTTHLAIVSSWGGQGSFKDFVDPEKEPIPWLKLNTITIDFYDSSSHTECDSLEELLIWLLNRKERNIGVKVLRTRKRYGSLAQRDKVESELIQQLGGVVGRIENFSRKGFMLWPPYDRGLGEVDKRRYVRV